LREKGELGIVSKTAFYFGREKKRFWVPQSQSWATTRSKDFQVRGVPLCVFLFVNFVYSEIVCMTRFDHEFLCFLWYESVVKWLLCGFGQFVCIVWELWEFTVLLCWGSVFTIRVTNLMFNSCTKCWIIWCIVGHSLMGF